MRAQVDVVILPPPRQLGLPKRFREWRAGQSRAILRIIDSDKRFFATVRPTGSGKTLDIAAALRLLGGKSVWLTSTRTLADQIARELGSRLGYTDVRGQSNYECAIDPPYTVDLGPCHAGMRCDLRLSGCTYFDRVRDARASATAVTVSNYSWWLAQNTYSEPFPAIDTLVLDEAHTAPDELAGFLSCELTESAVKSLLHGYEPPETGWHRWAHERALALEAELEILKVKARTERKARETFRAGKNLLAKLQRLSQAENERGWVIEKSTRWMRRTKQTIWRFDPVWPGPYAEMLFQEAPRVIFVSATMRPKTLELLNLKPRHYEFYETPSTFPVSRRPVIHFTGEPRVALTHRSDDGVLRLWLTRIDNIIRRRLDRKGIVHCVSYVRRDFLLRNSRYRDIFVIHASGEQAPAVTEFKNAEAPRIFLSPSATTGLDFPYDECEYQIIAKVPFPDQRSKILKARSRRDPEYPMYLTMLDVVQAAGRGMRAADDRCETFIVDDQWQWFHRVYSRFAPAWFLEACRRTETIPDPPPKLALTR